MRVIVCVGSTSIAMMQSWLGTPDGLKRPFRIVTMDERWFEVAAANRLPRSFFKDKLALMQFVLGHEIICLETNDRSLETRSMGASMFAMGAKSIVVASDEER